MQVVYDLNGLESEENWMSMAKIVVENSEQKHYIKCMNQVSHGMPVNPHGVGFNNQLIKPNSSFGSTPTKFKLVSKECFDHYLKFLVTKNDLFYRNVLSLGEF